jgi:hypothetical protein
MILPPLATPSPPALRGCFFVAVLMLSGCMGYMQERWAEDVIWYTDMNRRVATQDPDNPTIKALSAQIIAKDIEKCDYYLDAMRNAWTRNDILGFNKAHALFEGWKQKYTIDFATGSRPGQSEVDHGD